MQKKKSVISTILAFLVAVCLTLGIFSLLPKSKSAAAATTIQEIYNSDNNTFVKSELDKLYTALGSTTGYAGVKAKSDTANSNRHQMGTGSYINGDNTIASKKITVNFVGKQWYAVYLSNSTDNNVVLTLWAKDGYDCSDLNVDATILYSPHNSTSTYPGIMYSTSLVRAYLTGSDYSTNGTSTSLTHYTQGTVWSNFFTKLGGESNYKNILVQPQNMVWQQDIRASSVYGTNSDCGNEAKSGGTFASTSINLTSKGHYLDWQKDYIWLPGFTEVGNKDWPNGIWKCPDSTTDSQTLWYNSGQAYWLRSVTSSATNHYVKSDLSNQGAAPNGTARQIRPAIHLNLTYAESRSAETLDAPQDVELTYTGSAQTLSTAKSNHKADWYDVSTYNSKFDLTYEYDGTTYQAGNLIEAHDYTVTITPKSGQKIAWTDSTEINQQRKIKFKINPATIGVNFQTSGEGKTQKRTYTYHEGTTHNIELSKDIISLKGSNSATIYYLLEKHKENEYQNQAEHDAAVFANPPYIEDDRWSDQIPVAQDPGGYCVWFKIVAPNHKTYYGSDGNGKGSYISVHVATEVLQIQINDPTGNLGEWEYGSVPHNDLYSLLQGKYTIISPDTEEHDSIDHNQIRFWLTDQPDGQGDTPTGTYWDTGKYYLNAQWIDDSADHFVTFEWYKEPDGSTRQPWLQITPKQVELTWSGNANWESDKNNVSTSAKPYTDDEFNFVYDGTEKILTAKYEDINHSEKTVTVTVDGPHSAAGTYTAKVDDLKNYTFSNGTHDFNILKSINKWKNGTGYSRDNWSVGGTPSHETIPEDMFGNTATVAFFKTNNDGVLSDQYLSDFSDIKSPTTFYARVQVVVDSANTNNYDGLEQIVTFEIIECTNHQPADELGSSEEGHWHKCKFCGEMIESEIIPHVALPDSDETHNTTHHWKICKDCGQKYDEQEHSVIQNSVNETEPTCTTAGKRIDSCACGYTVEVEVAAKGHSYSDDVWESDETGHWHVCSECHERTDEARHTRHTYEEKEPTCTDEGYTEYILCDDCGYEIQKKIVLEALGHTLGTEKETVREATCTSDGLERGHCTVCGANATNIIPAKGHSYEEKIVKEATCTIDGEKAMVCKDCDDEQAGTRVSIAALGHEYDDYVVTKAATCTLAGKQQHTCTRCENVEEETIAALGHDYDDYVITKAATCTSSGKKVRTCTRCDDEEEERISPLGHSFIKHEMVEPTATEAGSIEYYECSLCETCFRDEDGNVEIEKSKTIIPALGTTGGSGGSDNSGGNSGSGNEGSVNPPLGGDTGLSNSGSNDFLEKNLWWIILLAAIIIVLIIIAIILSVIHSHRRDKMFMEMMARSQGGYQPMGGMQYADSQRPIFVLGQPNDGGQTLQLPSGLDEETLANAIALAMQKANATKPEEPADDVDVDGFYDDVDNYDGNE